MSDRMLSARQSFLALDQNHNFPSAPSEAQQPERDMTRPGAGEVDTVPVPPVQVQASTSRTARDLVQAGEHMRRPTLNSAINKGRRGARRCFRCGNEKIGPHHLAAAPSNSKNYCTVPVSERVHFWVEPTGYELEDCRQKEHKKKIARNWKKILEENEAIDDGWEGWIESSLQLQ